MVEILLNYVLKQFLIIQWLLYLLFNYYSTDDKIIVVKELSSVDMLC